MSSLADRISQPSSGATTSWADETTTAAAGTSNDANNMGGVTQAQTDGAAGNIHDAPGIVEPTYDVNVKLSDLQADPNDPLYSAKSFEELGL